MQDPDVRMVQWAAETSQKPTLSVGRNGEPMVEVLDNRASPSSMTYGEFVSKIRACLASGRAALVKNYSITGTQSPPLEWDEDSVKRLIRPDLPVQWHSKHVVS